MLAKPKKSAPNVNSRGKAYLKAADDLKLAALVVDKKLDVIAANNLAARVWLKRAADIKGKNLRDLAGEATPELRRGMVPPAAGVFRAADIDPKSATWQYTRSSLGAGFYGLILIPQTAALATDSTAQDRLRILFELLPVGVSVLNRNGEIIDVNTALTKILRVSHEDIRTGKIRARKYFDSGMKALSAENFPSAVVRRRKGAMRDFEMATMTDSGDLIWVSVNAIYTPELDETVIVSRDITAEKSATAKLKQRETFFHTILDALPGMVAYWDKKLVCKYANEQYVVWFGKRPEKVIGMHIADLMGDKLYALNRPFIEGALAGKMQIFERKLTRADGTTGWTSARYVPHKTDQGIEGFFVLVTDITSQVEARLAAERASKAKSAFFAMLSHELRTPLNGIIGTTDLLAATPLTDEQEKLVDMVRKSSDFLFKHIENLLQHARLEGEREIATPTEVDLRKLLEHVVATARTANPKKGQLLRIADFAADFPAIVVLDENKLSQVLMNLIGNALKYTNAGNVIVSCKVVERIRESVRVEFAVQDTGIGIPPRELSNIFEPYNHVATGAQRHSDGLGLGLSISKKLVHVMGGQIRVESQVNRGSKFTVELLGRLPEQTAEIKSVAAGPRGDIPEIARQYPARVLIVDDNPLNVMLMEHMLRKLGYKPVSVENGRAAFQQTTRNKFDIVFMDVHMPEVDGITATKAIRNSNASGNPVIIAVTANAAEENRSECLEAGMDDFLAKPIRLNDIIGLIQKWAPRPGSGPRG